MGNFISAQENAPIIGVNGYVIAKQTVSEVEKWPAISMNKLEKDRVTLYVYIDDLLQGKGYL